MEGRKVVTIDLPGAFLQANLLEDNKCCIIFEGVMLDMIIKINPKYRKCVRGNNKEKKIIWMSIKSNIRYDTQIKALLQWADGTTKSLGFQAKQLQQLCVEFTVESEQLTCQLHVDDLKLLHVNQKILNDFVKKLKVVFGKEVELSENTGMYMNI